MDDDEQPRIEIIDEDELPPATRTRDIPEYSTTEEEGCVIVKFQLPVDVIVAKKNSGVVVEWTENHLRVYFSDFPDPPIVDGPLRHSIRVPASGGAYSDVETRWYVEGRTFVVQLEKVDKKIHWERLFSADHYQKLAEAGNLAEQILMAFSLESKPEEAFKWWMRAAEQEDSRAELSVGKCYREGLGVAKDEAKVYLLGLVFWQFLTNFLSQCQEYFVRAALSKHPQPVALLQVGLWMRAGELLEYGQDRMLGISYRDLWHVCAREFAKMKPGEACAKLLVQEYLEAGDINKAQEYAALIGVKLEMSGKGRQKQVRSAPAPSAGGSSSSSGSGGGSGAGKASEDEKNLTFWRRVAIGTALFALTVKAARAFV